MSTSAARKPYQNGMPARSGSKRSQTKQQYKTFRAGTRIERWLSMQNDDNMEFESWLARATRRNATMKNARNLGGLSMTIIPDSVLGTALARKYRDYGRVAPKTVEIQRRLQENFELFVKDSVVVDGAFDDLDGTPRKRNVLWQGLEASVKPRLSSLGGGALCLTLRNEQLEEEYNQSLHFLRFEEGLHVTPDSRHGFLPHITLMYMNPSEAQRLTLPSFPPTISLEAPVVGRSIFHG